MGFHPKIIPQRLKPVRFRAMLRHGFSRALSKLLLPAIRNPNAIALRECASVDLGSLFP